MKPLVAACLIMCLGAALAAYPEQWEAKISFTLGQSVAGIANSATGFMAEGTVSFDGKKSRSATSFERSLDDKSGKTQKFKVIQNFAEKTMHIIMPETKGCFLVPLPIPTFKSLDDNKKFLGRRKFGRGTQAIELKVYEFTLPQVPMVIKQFSDDDGFNLIQHFRGTFFTTKQIQSQVFSDVVESIKDPNVFDLPSYCQTAKTYNFKNGDGFMNDIVNMFMAQSLINA